MKMTKGVKSKAEWAKAQKCDSGELQVTVLKTPVIAESQDVHRLPTKATNV